MYLDAPVYISGVQGANGVSYREGGVLGEISQEQDRGVLCLLAHLLRVDTLVRYRPGHAHRPGERRRLAPGLLL